MGYVFLFCLAILILAGVADGNVICIIILALIVLGAIALGIYTIITKYKESEKAKQEKDIESIDKEKRAYVGRIIIFVVAVILIVGLAVFFAVGIESEPKTPQAKYDDVMAGYDWGDNYYYSKKSHKVERIPWK
ncbi:MAG: hypothetical protein MJ125_05970 [Clostridia bacterium]|nr:hypothetical protein [Clostridia bacterium]